MSIAHVVQKLYSQSRKWRPYWFYAKLPWYWKNSPINEFYTLKLVRKKVLQGSVVQVVKKLEFQSCQWRPSWIYANEGFLAQPQLVSRSQIISIDPKCHYAKGNNSTTKCSVPSIWGALTNQLYGNYTGITALLSGIMLGVDIIASKSLSQRHFLVWRITLHYVRYDVVELNCALIANVKNINFFTFGSNIRYGKDIFRLQAMIHTRVTDIARQVKAYKLLFFWWIAFQIAKLMGPTWGPPGSCRSQMYPMLAPWTLSHSLSPIPARICNSVG